MSAAYSRGPPGLLQSRAHSLTAGLRMMQGVATGKINLFEFPDLDALVVAARGTHTWLDLMTNICMYIEVTFVQVPAPRPPACKNNGFSLLLLLLSRCMAARGPTNAIDAATVIHNLFA